MKATPNVFTVSDFFHLHSTRATYEDAVTLARRYSAEGGGNCPATIRDAHGCEWTVYAVGDAELVACDAVAFGRAYRCECGEPR